jgi:hypothetical protein
MTIVRKIERVETSGSEVFVYLDDGSRLEGVTSAKISTDLVKLKAHIYPEPTFTYRNCETREQVKLKRSETDSFFRNRNPSDWRLINEL